MIGKDSKKKGKDVVTRRRGRSPQRKGRGEERERKNLRKDRNSLKFLTKRPHSRNKRRVTFREMKKEGRVRGGGRRRRRRRRRRRFFSSTFFALTAPKNSGKDDQERVGSCKREKRAKGEGAERGKGVREATGKIGHVVLRDRRREA